MSGEEKLPAQEEELPTQEEQEEAAKAVRWPELQDEPEVDNAVTAEVEDLIGAQMVGGGEDESVSTS